MWGGGSRISVEEGALCVVRKDWVCLGGTFDPGKLHVTLRLEECNANPLSSKLGTYTTVKARFWP